MCLRNRRFLPALIIFFCVLITQAQTLYWVGGSGNFNDPNHWSLKSGGVSANKIPDSHTDVIFDDKSGKGTVSVNLVAIHYVKGFYSENQNLFVRIHGEENSVLQISGSVKATPLLNFKAKSQVVFSSQSFETQNLDLTFSNFNTNITFEKGVYKISSLTLLGGKTLKFGAGKYILDNSIISAGSIVNTDPIAEFVITESHLRASKKLRISTANVVAENLSVAADLETEGSYYVSSAVSTSKGYSSGNINAFCPVTISFAPACTGTCTGILQITLSTLCITPPYNVTVVNASCPTQAAALSSNGISSVYTVTNACACSLSNYQVIVRDGVNQIQASANGNFLRNEATLFDSNINPTCSYLCDGRLEGLIVGSSPFVVSVLPNTVTPSSFTTATGEYTVPLVCEGTYTFLTTDNDGCASSLTTAITAPQVLLHNQVTSSVSCFGFGNGSFSISPTGGTPNYTVSFNPGGTFTAGASSTVSLNGLSPSVITATITDSQGCQAVETTTIVEPTNFSITTSQQNISCGGTCSGQGTVAVTGVSGGTTTGSYSYSWVPAGGTNSTNPSLCAGNNTVFITDNILGCTTETVLNISQIAPLVITTTSTNVTCFGGSNGSATVTVAGGTTPIQITWVRASPLATISTISGTTSAIAGQSGGTYSVFATDANSCTAVEVFTLTQPSSSLSIVASSIQNANCPEVANGSATITPSGGNGGPFTFTWTPAITSSSVATGLSGGSVYAVVASDASNCITPNFTFSVSEPTLFAPGFTGANVSCHSASTGVIVSNPTGGTAPYTFTLTSPAATLVSGTGTFTGLPANNYTLLIGDANFPTNCAQAFTRTLTEPATPLSTAITTIAATCFGVCNGTLTINSGTSGTSPYSYTITGPSTNIQISASASPTTLTGRCAGTYIINTADANSCIFTTTAVISEPTPILLSVNSPTLACSNSTNGVLTATATGGAGTYTFTWLPGSVTGNPLTGLIPQSYSVTASDAAGCTSTMAITSVTVPSPLTVAQATTQTTCFGSSDGTASFTVSGGTAPYTYSLGGAPTPTNTVGSFSFLPAANYIGRIIDANGCTTNALNVVVSSPSVIAAVVNTAAVNCRGGCTGAITVTPSGGSPSYSYMLTGPASTNITNAGTAASATFTGRCAGNYTLTVTDASTCAQTFPVIISEPTTSLSTVVTPSSATCFNTCNGTLTINSGTSGTPPYTYTITGPSTNIQITTSILTPTVIQNRCAGTYVVRTVDSRSCSVTSTVVLNQPTQATLSVNPSTVSCSAGNGTLSANGILTPTISGGTSPYTFTWTGPSSFAANTQTIGNLSPGSYTLNYRPTGCAQSTTLSVLVSPRSSMTITPTFTNGISCANACDATATFTTSGGTPGTPSYTYQFVSLSSGTLTNTSGTFLNVCGNYTATAIDANGCRQSTLQTIAVPPNIAFAIDNKSVSCNGLSDGSFTITPSGGAAPYSYTLAGPLVTNTVSAPSGTSAVFSNLSEGTYTFFVGNSTFPATCAQVTIVAMTQPTSAVSSAINVTHPSCFSSCDGSLSAVNATGGTGTYTYVWTSTLVPLSVTSQTTNARCAGSYTLDVIDDNGCTFTTSAVLTPPTDITLLIDPAPVNSVTCFGGTNGSATITPTGGPSTAYSYIWNPGNLTGASISGVASNTYVVNVTSGTLGCNNDFTVVIPQPDPIAYSTTTTEVNCFGGNDGTVVFSLPTGGTAPFTYSLTGAPVSSNSTGTFTGLSAINYNGFVIDANGCTSNTTIAIAQPTAPLSIGTLTTENSCAICSGSVSLMPTGGTPAAGYTYVWTNSLGVIPAATDPTLGSLCPSPQYSITVTDSRGCSAASSFTISEKVIFVTASPGNVSCFGQADGTATITNISGGNPGYSQLWTPSSQTALSANSLSANVVYSIQVTDSSNPSCVGTQTLLLGEPNDIVLTNSLVTDASCFNSTDGTISTTITGGPSTYTFAWSGPNGFTSSSQNLTGLAFGDYSLTVSSGVSSCNKTFTFAVRTPSIIGVTYDNDDPINCTNVNSGTIIVIPTGGNGTYAFSWATNPATTGTVNNVGPGTYNYSITSGACTQTFFTSLGSPLAPPLTIVSSTNVNCFGASTGGATFSTTAAQPISYTWTPNVTSTGAGSFVTATGIPSATYVVNMLDDNQCANSATVVITQPTSSITITHSLTNVACNSASTGVISASVSGGTPGTPSYTFNWSTGSSATGIVSSITSLTALTTGASYSVLVTDGLGCTASESYTLTEPVPFTFTTNSGNINCFGAANGSIVVVATPTNGVVYNWPAVPSTPFAGSTNSLVSGLSPGVYTVNVTNASCTAVGTNTIEITQPTALAGTVAISQNSVTCFGGNDVIASHTVTGGTGPYTYSWTGSPSTTNTASNLSAGSHTVFVADANGCLTQNVFVIGTPAVFDATLTASNPLCFAAANGGITTQLTGNQGAVNFTWAPSGSGQNPSSLSVTGTQIFTLVAADASLCTITKTVQLVEPLALLANLSFTNPNCFGNCDGAGFSSPLNAAGSTTITWLPSNTVSTSISGLCSHPLNGNPNVYTVNVVDDNGCIAIETFSLSVPTDIVTTSTVSPALCGIANGSIVVTTTGGVGPYTYSWSPVVNTTTVVTNLNFGIYTLSVLDANGCSDIITVPVSASDGPTATVNSSSIQCNSICSGSIALSAISPTNTTIQWLPPLQASVTAATLNNLCVGNYSVELTNPANNCKSFYGVAISEPPPVTVSSTSTEPTCFGICDGSISIAIAGGVPGYTFNWSGPDAFSSTNSTITNLCGGDFTLTIVDANSCTNTPIFSIPVLNNIVIQQPVSVTNNLCFGDCTGSATINVVSTTTNVLTASVNWSNGQFGPVGTSLCNGVYSVIVTDTRGCNNTFSVPISSAPELIVNANLTQPDCNQCNGVAELVVSGGNGPAYNYSWTNGATSPEISDLCAGLYQVLVSDNQNCKKLQNILINSSNGITSDSVEVQDELCAIPCSGAATVTAVGGTSPISYNWINPTLSNNSSSAGNLCPGTYFVQMTDANNCIRTSSVAINAASSLSVSPFVTPPTCALAPADGSIYVVVAGNTGTLNYTWNPGAITTSTLGNVAPGTYTLVVEDALTGCSKTEIISVSNLTGPTLTAVQKNIDCNTAEGSVSVTASSAVSYSWSTNATSSVATNLLSGPVTVTVTDNNGCSTTRSFTIESTPALEVQTVMQSIKCFNDCDGSIILLPFSGTLPYTFSMAIPGGSTSSTNYRTDSLCAGSYTAVVIDALGCRDTTLVNIINPTAITSTINLIDASCSTLADGSASVLTVGGTGPYTYTWTGVGGFTSNSFTVENLLSGTYSLQVTDTLGCESIVFTAEVIPTVTIIANAGLDTLVCPGTEVILTGTNSIGAVSYSWFLIPSSNPVSSVENNPVFAIETESYELLTLSSLPGCVDRDTVVVNVFETPLLDAGPPSYTISVYSSTVIGGNPTSISGGPTHTWAPAEYIDNPFAQNPATTNTIDITFTVSMIFGNECFISDTILVAVLPEIVINNGFSPNGDGKNDFWYIDYIDQFPDNTVEVYNRWGEQLFYSRGYLQPFDGKFKGQDLPVGTYYYVIKLNHPRFTKPYTGPLTIFR